MSFKQCLEYTHSEYTSSPCSRTRLVVFHESIPPFQPDVALFCSQVNGQEGFEAASPDLRVHSEVVGVVVFCKMVLRTRYRNVMIDSIEHRLSGDYGLGRWYWAPTQAYANRVIERLSDQLRPVDSTRRDRSPKHCVDWEIPAIGCQHHQPIWRPSNRIGRSCCSSWWTRLHSSHHLPSFSANRTVGSMKSHWD